ncbi:Signal-Regulatory Protein Beta-1 Isoform 3 [Manis pentadactyla]|nr:Signal-Regulatory Protein Beta-1 Isoform 3 [Manis pentadactyla]
MFKVTEPPTPKKNLDGTYAQESSQGSKSVLTRKVQQEAQPPIQANLILSPSSHSTYKPIGSTGGGAPLLSTEQSLVLPARVWTQQPPRVSTMPNPASWPHPPPCLLLTLLLRLTGPEPPPQLLVALLLGHKVLLAIGVFAIYVHKMRRA